MIFIMTINCIVFIQREYKVFLFVYFLFIYIYVKSILKNASIHKKK